MLRRVSKVVAVNAIQKPDAVVPAVVLRRPQRLGRKYMVTLNSTDTSAVPMSRTLARLARSVTPIAAPICHVLGTFTLHIPATARLPRPHAKP